MIKPILPEKVDTTVTTAPVEGITDILSSETRITSPANPIDVTANLHLLQLAEKTQKSIPEHGIYLRNLLYTDVGDRAFITSEDISGYVSSREIVDTLIKLGMPPAAIEDRINRAADIARHEDRYYGEVRNMVFKNKPVAENLMSIEGLHALKAVAETQGLDVFFDEQKTSKNELKDQVDRAVFFLGMQTMYNKARINEIVIDASKQVEEIRAGLRPGYTTPSQTLDVNAMMNEAYTHEISLEQDQSQTQGLGL